MFCPHCGQPRTAADLTCRHCAQALPALSATTATSLPEPALGFGPTIRHCLDLYFVTDGRASRAEYWWFALFTVLVTLPFRVLGELTDGDAGLLFHGVGLLLGLALMAPGIAVAARRLHDHDRSAWWLLLVLTGVGLLPVLYWLVTRGDAEANRHGEPAQRLQARPATRNNLGLAVFTGVVALALVMLAAIGSRQHDGEAPAATEAEADTAAETTADESPQEMTGVVANEVGTALSEYDDSLRSDDVDAESEITGSLGQAALAGPVSRPSGHGASGQQAPPQDIGICVSAKVATYLREFGEQADVPPELVERFTQACHAGL